MKNLFGVEDSFFACKMMGIWELTCYETFNLAAYLGAGLGCRLRRAVD